MTKTKLTTLTGPPDIAGITSSGYVVINGASDAVAYPLTGGNPVIIEHNGTAWAVRNEHVATSTAVWSAAGGDVPFVVPPNDGGMYLNDDGSAVLAVGNCQPWGEGNIRCDLTLSLPGTGATKMVDGGCGAGLADGFACYIVPLGRFFLQYAVPNEAYAVSVIDPRGVLTHGGVPRTFDSTQQKVVVRGAAGFATAPIAGGDPDTVYFPLASIGSVAASRVPSSPWLLTDDDVAYTGSDDTLQLLHAGSVVKTGKPCHAIVAVDPRSRYVVCEDAPPDQSEHLVALSTLLSDQALPLGGNVVTDNGDGLLGWSAQAQKREWMRLDAPASGSVDALVGRVMAGDGLVVGGVELLDVCADGALTPLFDPKAATADFRSALSPDKRYLVYYDEVQKTLMSMQLRP